MLLSLGVVQGQVPDSVLDMSVVALQHGVSPDSLVALLNGNVSDSGVDVTSFKELGGALSRLAEEERRFGSKVTELIKVNTNYSLSSSFTCFEIRIRDIARCIQKQRPDSSVDACQQ